LGLYQGRFSGRILRGRYPPGTLQPDQGRQDSLGLSGPFIGAQQAWWRLEADLERWGQELESETVTLCQDVLGIAVEDIAMVELGKSLVRLEVEGMSAYAFDKRAMFGVWGKRVRKDGLLGKRSEYFSIVVEND